MGHRTLLNQQHVKEEYRQCDKLIVGDELETPVLLVIFFVKYE